MKKHILFTLGLCVTTFALTLAGCGQSSGSTTNTPAASSAGIDTSAASAAPSGSDTATGAAKDNVRIGIIQLVEHPALDDARLGFLEGLAEAGYIEGKNLTVNVQNAQGEQANCQTIAGQFANEHYDLVLAIATPAAQAAANVIQDTPILVTAVTDPAKANLVASNEKPGGHISGTSDRSPIDQQIQLVKKLVPDAKRLTILYTSSEVNSEMQAKEAQTYAEAAGLTVTIKTVSSSNEVQQVVESAVADTDAIYIPTDNLIASSMGVVSQVAIQAKIPVIGGEENQLLNGALATVGLNYKDLGKQTGAMAARVLSGENIAEMPIEYAAKNAISINPDTAEAIGVTIPDDLKQTAQMINTKKA